MNLSWNKLKLLLKWMLASCRLLGVGTGWWESRVVRWQSQVTVAFGGRVLMAKMCMLQNHLESGYSLLECWTSLFDKTYQLRNQLDFLFQSGKSHTLIWSNFENQIGVFFGLVFFSFLFRTWRICGFSSLLLTI